MKQKLPLWLIISAAILLGSLIVNQVFWVYHSARQQEEQFNKQIQMALASIEGNIEKDLDLCTSVDGCLIEKKEISCSSFLQNNQSWARTDAMISYELKRFNIDLNYNFDICYKSFSNLTENEGYQQNMDKVFEHDGIVLYLEFPDKSRYLMNQIGSVFISSILLIVFLSIVFALTYRFYKRERNFSIRTRDFINNMTHEFNTPLTNISLANSMIFRGADRNDTSKIKEYSNVIDEESQRLFKNCNDLLQMAKIEDSSSELEELIDAHVIIDCVINRKRKTKMNYKFTIESQFDADTYMVLGQESLFFNTVSNLLDNAIKYSQNNLKIMIITSNEKGYLKLQIKDNGIGIKNSYLPNIFDKFYRVPDGDRHNVKGFGLGLAYVKMVVNKMKGNVNVESKLGLGTTFNILIPVTNN